MIWIRRILTVVAILAALIVSLVWAIALALRLPGPGWLTGAVAVLYVIASAAVLIFLRPRRRAAAVWAATQLALLFWWSTIWPSNDRDWVPEVARLPTAEVHDNTLVVHNVRNFDYRTETDFTPAWDTRTYD